MAMDYQNLIVFTEFPDPDKPSLGLLNALSYMDVTLVGFYEVPQTETIEDARSTHEASIQTALDEMETRFEEHGLRVQTEVVFGHDKTEARDRITNQMECDGVLLSREVSTIGRILVGLRDTRNAERIADFVDFIDQQKIIHITLIHVARETTDSDEISYGRQTLKEMKAKLDNRGVNRHAIDMEIKISDDPLHELTQAARGYDLAVLGRTEESPGEQVFGRVSNRITDRGNTPVLVVF